MTQTLELFGLSLPVPADGAIARPADGAVTFDPAGWSVVLSASHRRLEVRRIVARVGPTAVRLALTVPCELHGTVWRPSGPALTSFTFLVQPVGAPVDTTVRVDLGGIELTDDPRLQPVEGRLLLRADSSWRDDPSVPIRLFANLDQPPAIALDLARGELVLGDGAFVVETHAPAQRAGGLARFFVRRHASRCSVHPLATLSQAKFTLEADPLREVALPLHVASEARANVSPANPLFASAGLRTYGLRLAFSTAAGAATRLVELVAVPRAPGGAIELVLHAYADQHDEAPHVRLAELPLVMRPERAGFTGSLLIGAEVDAAAPSGAWLHGVLRDAEIALPERARLTLEPQDVAAPASTVAASLQCFETLPCLVGSGLGDQARLRIVKPGRGYAAGAGAAGSSPAQHVDLGGTVAALPLLEARTVKALGAALARPYFARIDHIVRALRDTVRDTTHESQLHEGPLPAPGAAGVASASNGSTVQPRSLYDQLAQQPAGAATPRYEPYDVLQRLGRGITATITIDPDASPDYILLFPGALRIDPDLWRELLGPTTGDLARTTPFRLSENDFTQPRPDGRALGILKLSRSKALGDLLTELAAQIPAPPSLGQGQPAPAWREVIDPSIGDPSWVGLVLFDVAAKTLAAHDLHALFRDASLAVPYLAISPSSDGTARPSFASRLLYQDPTPLPPDEPETQFLVRRIDARWAGAELAALDVDAVLRVGDFLGLRRLPASIVEILGRYDLRAKQVRFKASFGKPVALLPDDITVGPIRQLDVRSVDVIFTDGRARVTADGVVTLGDFDLPAFVGFKSRESAIGFNGLGFSLPALGELGDLLTVDVDLPSLRLPLDNKIFDLGGFELSLVGLDFLKGLTLDAWRSLPGQDFGFGDAPSALAVRWRLTLMKLPGLALKSIDRLIIDLTLGVALRGASAWDFSRIRLGFQALDFRDLDLDLLRFLTLKVRRLSIGRDPEHRLTRLIAEGVHVDVLQHTIIDRLTFLIFRTDAIDGRPARTGFLAHMPLTEDRSGFLSFQWALAGQNVSIDRDLGRQLIEIQPDNALDTDQVGRAISDAIARGGLYGATDADERWLFGAGLAIGGGFLEGRAIVQDQGYVGIALRGKMLEQWFGYRLAIGVAYNKGSRPDQDSFAIALTVPQVTLPTFSFMGGVIVLEIVMNGDFLLDVGFPRLNSAGGREWDRAFGAIVGILQGSGGFYLAKRSGSSGRTGDVSYLRVSAGYAVQAGFGASFGGGMITAWATIGLYAIVEGDALLFESNVKQLCLVGAVGILLRGAAELNWWIISVRVTLVVSAEARVHIAWRSALLGDPAADLPCALGAENGRVKIRVSFTVYAQVRGEACIGSGWFSICKSVTATLPMTISQELLL